MYGDTSVIRALARQLRAQGAEVRVEADALVRAAEAVPWTGHAAEAMRALVHEQAGRLRICADRHDEAAEALERHAQEVDHLVAVIAAIERRATHLLHDALAGGMGLVRSVSSHVVPDALGDWAGTFRPPPSGSREWLDVVVPHVA